MNHRRRDILLYAGASSAAALGHQGSLLAAAPDVPAGPPTAPTKQASGLGSIELDAHSASQDDQVGGRVRLTYFGPGPAPVFRLRKGSEIKVHLTNSLSEATSLDWHGMRLPRGLALMPGPNGAPLAPKSSADLALLLPDPGTFWFHPGLVPGSTDQTARGLAGVLVVEETDPPQVDLDQVLLLTENVPHSDTAPPSAAGPPLAPRVILVNAKERPGIELVPPGARLRLRIVNGSTRRALAVTFQGARPLVVAIDGQPSELFAPLNNLVPVGPGARFDILVDLPQNAGAEFQVLLRRTETMPAGADEPIFLARTEGSPRIARDPIKALPPNPCLPRYVPLERSTRATIAVERGSGPKSVTEGPSWSVNGVAGIALGRKPLFSAKRNTPVTLTFINKSPDLIALRLHGHVMRLLHAMDDGWEPYWRDSVLVPPGMTHHAAFLADNPGQWLIDSPFFEQVANGLRTWFEVV